MLSKKSKEELKRILGGMALSRSGDMLDLERFGLSIVRYVLARESAKREIKDHE